MIFLKENKNCCRIVMFLLLIISIPWTTAIVVLKNNGYNGLLIAIHKDIPENLKLINGIKDMLTVASSHLYKTTKNSVYFDEVTIVIPPSWSSSSNYETLQGGDYFSRAEVRVDRANPKYGNTPYTLQPGQCGERGEYIHFTPEFIMDTANNVRHVYGNPGKIFVHEWAHLRYGIFDEYVDGAVSQLPKFYLDENNKIRPTGCSEGVRGWLRKKDGSVCERGEDGLPTSDCMFYPDLKFRMNETNKPSIMYLPGHESADGFCENDNSNGRLHNIFAQNKHSIMCQGRSNWDVISGNIDFNVLNPLATIVNIAPKFRLVQPKKDQTIPYVLVLDVSGSMQGNRMELQHAAVSRFIKIHLINSSMVGMVSFSTSAQVLSTMTSVNDKTRIELLALIPTVANGWTAIGQGILAGIKLLRDSGIPTEGALMLLVSDGEENVAPYINDILSEIIASKIIINTIAFGKQASINFEKLVLLTGGKGSVFNDDKTSHKLLDTAFVDAATSRLAMELKSIEIVNRDILIKTGEHFQSYFFIDKAVGRNTMFLITYNGKINSNSPEPVEHFLWSPTGVAFNSSSVEFISDRNTLSLGFKLPQAMPGKWMYKISNRQTTSTNLTLMVATEISDLNVQPVRIRAWISQLNISFSSRVKVYAEVKIGYNAIINATVIGTVGRPIGDPITMILYDNGAGADTEENDGIYSGYFSNFNAVGRYSVEAVVASNGYAKILVAKGANNVRVSRSATLSKAFQENENSQDFFDPYQMTSLTGQTLKKELEVEQINDFERYASGGAFRLNNFISVDIIPPSRVTNLKISFVNDTGRVVHLKWTAADDNGSGKGVFTEVRYHQNLTFLLKNFNMSYKYHESENLNELMVELPSYINLNESNFRVYFALRSRDEAGNEGEISNWEMVQFLNPGFVNNNNSFLKCKASLLCLQWYIILIIVVTSIIVIFIIVFIVFKIACQVKSAESISMEAIAKKEDANQV